MQKQKSVLITVGTTEFDQLIKKVDDPQIYQLFLQNGFTKLYIQKGRGKYHPNKYIGLIDVEVFDFLKDIGKIQDQVDLIISHCGAGTLLECLHKNKKICAIINETLMNNHQLELYKVLKLQNYITGMQNINNFQNKVKLRMINQQYQLQDVFNEEVQTYETQNMNIFETVLESIYY